MRGGRKGRNRHLYACCIWHKGVRIKDLDVTNKMMWGGPPRSDTCQAKELGNDDSADKRVHCSDANKERCSSYAQGIGM